MCDEEVFDIVVLPMCPHCATTNEAFDLVKEYASDGIKSLFLHCKNCGRCVVAEMKDSIELQPVFDNFTHLYPELFPTDIPQFLPEKVESQFIQAKHSLQVNYYEAACIMARRCIETVCTYFNAEGNNLYSKIDNLQTRGLLTQALTDWAHEIRDIGNDATHDNITKQDANDAVYFSEMLLIYLYTLPEKIRQRKA